MLIVVYQKDEGEYIRWGSFNREKDALKFVQYLLKSITPSVIPNFVVVVSAVQGIAEYSLEEYTIEAKKHV